MITKTKIWGLIVEEMKTKQRLDKLTKIVMKKIENLEKEDVESANKQELVVVAQQFIILSMKL